MIMKHNQLGEDGRIFALLLALAFILGSLFVAPIGDTYYGTFALYEGSWFTAQAASVVFAQITVIVMLRKKYYVASYATGLALLFTGLLDIPISLVIRKKWRDLFSFSITLVPFAIFYMAWNDYRFGSIWQTGYSLIPGFLLEQWYRGGIVNVAYLPKNLIGTSLNFHLLGIV